MVRHDRGDRRRAGGRALVLPGGRRGRNGGAFHYHEPDQLEGIEFRAVDNRLIALKLVQVGLRGAAMFGPDGRVLQPSEVLEQFDESNDAELPGGILESFGRLFKNDLRLFVYPMLRDGTVTTIHNLAVGDQLQPLYDYLERRGSFVDLDNYKPEYLPILSRDVLRRIAGGDAMWESMVPVEVGALIKKRGFFGYTRPDQG